MANERVHKGMRDSFGLSNFFFFSINLLDINFLAPYVGLYLPACLLPSFLLLDFDVIH